MSSQRRSRKDKQNSNSNPINYTCGVCKQVHEFDDAKPYQCVNPLFAEVKEEPENSNP